MKWALSAAAVVSGSDLVSGAGFNDDVHGTSRRMAPMAGALVRG